MAFINCLPTAKQPQNVFFRTSVNLIFLLFCCCYCFCDSPNVKFGFDSTYVWMDVCVCLIMFSISKTKSKNPASWWLSKKTSKVRGNVKKTKTQTMESKHTIKKTGKNSMHSSVDTSLNVCVCV